MKVLELKIPPIIIMALIGVIMWFVATLVPQLVLVIPGQVILAAIAGFTSIALILAGAIAFRVAGTTVNPMQPSNTSSLVTSPNIARASKIRADLPETHFTIG